MTNHTQGLRYAGFSPDDRLVVTAGSDNVALICHASDGKPFRTFQHKSSVTHASFSPDGKRLATACLDHEAHIWDIETGKEVVPGFRHGDGLSSVEFS